MPSLLIVDDKLSLREPLVAYLTGEGFTVREAAGAAQARQLVGEAIPDLVLLDMMMPGEDGLLLCRHLVESRSIPTIFLTAQAEATDRIVGLEIGADDYIVKPFQPRELVARIRNVLRRAARSSVEVLSGKDFLFEGWRLDSLKRRLEAPYGAEVAISSVEFRLLTVFLEHPRQVLPRDRLLDMVQGREPHSFDRAIDNQISRLRRKIEIDSRNPLMIQTIWGRGYMLAVDVRRVPGTTEWPPAHDAPALMGRNPSG